LYPAAIWHYSRGMALAAKGNLEAAQKELDDVKIIARDARLEKLMIWDLNSATNLVNIAQFTLEGELLAHQKKYDEAFIWLKKAAAIEDILNYNEPPDWFFSVRHTLGHWQVQAKQFKEAEQTYREDLELFKENGWALMGMYNSLKGQGRSVEARAIMKRFERAWKWADIKISSSRLF
jgi:tetratricopeptide (TPR) repeat protein